MFREIVFIMLILTEAKAAKILCIFMTPAYSHQSVFRPIWKELSLRGHQVTVYTPNPINDPSLTNLTEVDLGFSYKHINKFTNVFFGKKRSPIEELKMLGDFYATVFDTQMSSPEMQQLLANKNNESYDLFLVEYLYLPMFGFKDVYKCPMVGISSLPLSIRTQKMFGVSRHPVLNPDYLLSFSDNLSFKERIISTAYSLFVQALSNVVASNLYTKIARKYFGERIGDIYEIAKDASLVLVNSNFATTNIQPSVAAIVEVPGLHLQPPKSLPEDLQKFLDKSPEGVIYFSLGSNVELRHVPDESLKKISGAFSDLPYKVLLKSDEDIFSHLSNVKTVGWLPQQDVLRHPNVKLFISQGGLQSIDEAITSETPMLIVPFYGDQYFNAHKMVSNGIALSVDFADFSKEDLIDKIKMLISDDKYKKTAAKLSSMAYDQPIAPLEKAIWWIEYVLKHDGAPHLRYKALDMPFYQYYLLDVYLLFAVIIGVFAYVLFKFYRTIMAVYQFSSRILLWIKSKPKQS